MLLPMPKMAFPAVARGSGNFCRPARQSLVADPQRPLARAHHRRARQRGPAPHPGYELPGLEQDRQRSFLPPSLLRLHARLGRVRKGLRRRPFLKDFPTVPRLEPASRMDPVEALRYEQGPSCASKASLL